MKLLHYFPTTRLTEGGTIRAAIDLCTVLANRGNEVLWITCDDTDAPESWKNGEPNTPTIISLGKFQKKGLRLTQEQIATATKIAKDVDVAHIHAMWEPSNPQIAKACRSVGTPWVLSIHGMLDDWSMSQRGLKKQIYLATMGRILLRDTTTFHTTAEEECQQASRWFKHNNSVVIPCIVDLESYREVPNPQEAINAFGESEYPTILFLSRVHEKKSIETLIDATAILKERGAHIRVLIAGTGEESYIETLRARTVTAGVSEYVSFLGMVVGTLKLSLFAMADIFALPTQQENFGLVFPEAMLCETAVIGTKGTDIWRELEESGAIIADRTPECFADSIDELLNDRVRLERLGKTGREHMLKWLDVETVGKQYEEMYQNVLTNGN